MSHTNAQRDESLKFTNVRRRTFVTFEFNKMVSNTSHEAPLTRKDAEGKELFEKGQEIQEEAFGAEAGSVFELLKLLV
ncbi:hypothetical protein RCL_jg6226.t1 [Rhizophagus clarus]|uniref:Uncharacterized protein n=1 Tax=Rhizophagus clarus TaxID=94130 RepID=A0A8H3L0E7_9GLOM|nr:hypothetical protein RCL_jg6226.t1 [Rhizophagus clarus]